MAKKIFVTTAIIFSSLVWGYSPIVIADTELEKQNVQDELSEDDLNDMLNDMLNLGSDDIPKPPTPPTDEEMKITFMDRVRFLRRLPFKTKIWIIKEHILFNKGKYAAVGGLSAAGITSLLVYLYRRKQDNQNQ